MEHFSILHVFVFLSLVMLGSHAALESEDYWRSVLPNTAMPNIVQELLHHEWTEEKGTSVTVGKGGVGVSTGKQGGSGTNVGVGKGGVGVSTGKPGGSGTNVGVGKGGIGVSTGKPGGSGTNVGVGKGGVGVRTGKGTNVGVGKGGVSVGVRGKGHPVVVKVHPYSPFLYSYAATEDQLHEDPNVALFFLEKDLREGTQMNLHFPKSSYESAEFLPRHVSKSIPFSSNKLLQILNRFSVDPKSEEAEAMKKTIEECERSGIKGEEKFCATSLESMVDFSTSKLGTRNVDAVSTGVDERGDGEPQKFNVEGVKKLTDGSAVVCHRQDYAYAVFYCHRTSETAAYRVSLVGRGDGTRAEAVAVCHKDTSEWNPKHLAFQVLNVKPGTVPVCHFLPEDHIVWVSK